MKIDKGIVFKVGKNAFWYTKGMKTIKAYYSGQLPKIRDMVYVKGMERVEPERKRIERTDEFYYTMHVKHLVNFSKALESPRDILTELDCGDNELRNTVIKELEKENFPKEYRKEYREKIECAKDLDKKVGLTYEGVLK